MKPTALLAATVLLGLAGCSPSGSSEKASNTQSAVETTTQASFDDLRSQGYMITQVLDISDDAQKNIWPNDSTQPSYEIILQKGSSTATCTLSMINFISMIDSALQNSKYCNKR